MNIGKQKIQFGTWGHRPVYDSSGEQTGIVNEFYPIADPLTDKEVMAVIGALSKLKEMNHKDCKDDALRYKTDGVNEPDPHDFCANAKQGEPWEDQIANKAKTQVHALKNLPESGCAATADTKAGNIFDLVDALVNQIKIQGVKEESGKAKERTNSHWLIDWYMKSQLDGMKNGPKHYSCRINDERYQIGTAEIAQLRKENAELKDWNDKLNECCNSLESEVQMLKAKIYDIQNKEK